MLSWVEILLAAWCLLALGVSVWVLVDHFLASNVPPAISHSIKFRILYVFFHLTVTWGNLLEMMKICAMPTFCCFIQDILVTKNKCGVFVKNLCFGTIPVRLFQPKAPSSRLRRGIVFFHGGGAVFGSLDTYHNLCHLLALKTDSVVLSVGYRKLPSNHHPTILYDCRNATIHFLKSLDDYGVDPSRVLACGDSIGGAAVVAVLQDLMRIPDLPQIRAQILIYPVLQTVSFQLPSYLQSQNVPFLNRDFMMFCASKYLAIDHSWKDAWVTGSFISPDIWKKYEKWLSPDNIPKRFKSGYQSPIFPAPFNEAAYLEMKHVFEAHISPLVADDETIARLPEAFLVSLHWDILRDDTLLYKKRLEDQGVPVTWHHVEDGFHGCLVLFDKILFSFPCSLSILYAVVSYIKSI